MAEVEIDVAKLNEAVREEARLVQTAVDEVSVTPGLYWLVR
jgi:hypothetical protein